MTGRVMVVGSVNDDLVVEADRLPRPGETVVGRAIRHSPGGKGANQAVAAARLGALTRFVGAVGDDDAGRRLRSFLEGVGIDTSGLRTVDGPTGTAVVTVDAEGENAIVVIPGANASPAAAWFDHTDPDVDVVVGQGEIPLDATRAAFDAARRAGATSVWNPAPVPLGATAVLDAVDVLVVNETELATLAGVAVDAATPTGDLLAAMDRVPFASSRPVVATLGARGVVARIEGAAHEVAAPEVEVVDTTGAGDAFVGAMAERLAAGCDLGESIADAVATSAIVVGRPGAGPAMPTAAEVAALRPRAGVRRPGFGGSGGR